MILYFAPGGRLGNQLFAVCYLESIRRKSERVFSTKLGSVLSIVSGLRRYHNIDAFLFILLVDKVLEPLTRSLLARFRIISSRYEQTDGTVTFRRGFLPVTYVRGYFQHARLPEQSPFRLKIKRKFLQEAQQALSESDGRTPLFVHVRRSDLLNFWVWGKQNPALPVSYYREAVSLLQSRIPDPFFFFMGDDPAWAQDAFPGLQKARLIRRSPAVDLALMSMCAGGVISNSTFAWWGAFQCAGSGLVVAPRYWLGWRSGSWYPPGIEAPWFQHIEVR